MNLNPVNSNTYSREHQYLNVNIVKTNFFSSGILRDQDQQCWLGLANQRHQSTFQAHSDMLQWIFLLFVKRVAILCKEMFSELGKYKITVCLRKSLSKTIFPDFFHFSVCLFPECELKISIQGQVGQAVFLVGSESSTHFQFKIGHNSLDMCLGGDLAKPLTKA